MQDLARQDSQGAAEPPGTVGTQDTGQDTPARPGPSEAAGQGNGVAPIGPRPVGRPKGSSNRNRVATQERINRRADPLGFLIDVSNGRPVRIAGRGKTAVMHQPTLEQVFEAKALLLRKIMPDLKSTEIQGVVDHGLNIQLISYRDSDVEPDAS